MKNPWKKARDFILEDLWAVDRSSFGRWRAPLLDALRLITVVVKDVFSGEFTHRAMGLVYTTLLSLVPLLAGAEISFYYQNPQSLVLESDGGVPDARLVEQTAVSITSRT